MGTSGMILGKIFITVTASAILIQGLCVEPDVLNTHDLQVGRGRVAKQAALCLDFPPFVQLEMGVHLSELFDQMTPEAELVTHPETATQELGVGFANGINPLSAFLH